MCVWGGDGGAHYKNQLNVLPFSPTETEILQIVAPSLGG